MATRRAQLNHLLVRFLGVPEDETVKPDNVYRRLVVAVGAAQLRDLCIYRMKILKPLTSVMLRITIACV